MSKWALLPIELCEVKLTQPGGLRNAFLNHESGERLGSRNIVQQEFVNRILNSKLKKSA